MTITMFAGLRGKVREDVDLSATNWFRVGGKADYVFRPADVEDLAAFIKQKPDDVPITVLGVGSNVIVRDGGVVGVVVKLGAGFTWLSEKNGLLQAGAGNLDYNVAMYAAEHSIKGLEFLSGIPGTIGGALRMNAGAYEREVKDVLVSAQLVDAQGEIHEMPVDKLGYSYRHSEIPKSWIFTRATFRAEMGRASDIIAQIKQIQEAREATQPVKERTGGSTFRNPPPVSVAQKDGTTQKKSA